VFPARDRSVLAEHPGADEHAAFWANLYEGHDLFEKDHRVPKVSVLRDGRYAFSAP
jgi:murein L,D-transpeptidase YafK